ncbi:F0F1 ATP synthase subunit epsilon [Labrys wisconsinensis]|uniref:ATP synthase epsilon chain n=1 Tax=Labrys wisconsinensis TaxID=425677 RepID=A0ABU0J200_9HYPH|nr:F0F1 ATP synthase subunit epsilon [Labrys wisconsinensis]MDQ0468277.1 F-type H+-transporting ATPase subunit epsilon [Labrys wisconsinensis]
MATFQFELVTPEKLLFSGPVEGVVIPGTEGDFEVLAQHAPVMSTIRPGLIAVRETASGAPRRLFVRGGFAEVNPDGLTILAEQAIPVEELSPERLAREITMMEEDVADATSDVARAKAALKLGQLRELQRAIAH